MSHWSRYDKPNGQKRESTVCGAAGRRAVDGVACMPSFGAIKQLQKRCEGADRATCKKALEEHNDDEDLAAQHIAATTEFKDSKAQQATGAAAKRAGIEIINDAPTNSSVSVITIEVGDGETYPSYGDTLSMHYKGTLAESGEEFDSSYKRGREFDFKIGHGKVIKGWDEAIMKMSLGEKAQLHIPASKAYGAQGNGPVPPNADLVFDVHLLKITRQTSCLGPGQHGGVQRQHHESAPAPTTRSCCRSTRSLPASAILSLSRLCTRPSQ